MSAQAAATLHTIWQLPVGKRADKRLCPRCDQQVLERKWFSDAKLVEIDQCPMCAGVWLDAGEFSRVYEEVKGAKVSTRLWAEAMAAAVAAASENRLSG